jgi:hypothetical protein
LCNLQVALYGCGGCASLKLLNTDEDKKVEVSLRDTHYVLRCYNLSEFTFKLENIGKRYVFSFLNHEFVKDNLVICVLRDAFARIVVVDQQSDVPIDDCDVQPSNSCVILSREKMVRVTVFEVCCIEGNSLSARTSIYACTYPLPHAILPTPPC